MLMQREGLSLRTARSEVQERSAAEANGAAAELGLTSMRPQRRKAGHLVTHGE